MKKVGRHFICTEGIEYKYEEQKYYCNKHYIQVTGAVTGFGYVLLESQIARWLPTKKEKFLGYISLCIPSAMLARLVRKITGTKGTPLEVFLMDYYYKMEKKLLKDK